MYSVKHRAVFRSKGKLFTNDEFLWKAIRLKLLHVMKRKHKDRLRTQMKADERDANRSSWGD
jgi:hypothetical protein